MSKTLRPGPDICERLGWTNEQFLEWFDGLSQRLMGVNAPTLGKDPDCPFCLPGCHAESEYTAKDQESWDQINPEFFRPDWGCENCADLFWMETPPEWEEEAP